MKEVLRIVRRKGKSMFPFYMHRANRTVAFATTRVALSVTTNRLTAYKDDMSITYQLEVSTTKPTQFRVSVVHGDKDLPPSADFLFIGIYDTPEQLTDALEPYLQMEEGS